MQCLHCQVGTMVVPEDMHPSYTLCNSCNAIELNYKPADYQEPLHQIEYKLAENGTIKPQILGIFGGYGSGKSRASLQEFFLRCMENPNGTGLITAPTLQLLKRTTIKTLINEIIPPPLIESYNKSDMEIKLINGFTIYAIPSDDDEKLRSINAGLIHMEESSAIKRSIFDQLLSRMRDPFVKNKAIFVCSNPEQGWLKDVLVDNEKRKDPRHPEHEDYNPYINVFIWPTQLNTHLPPDFIEINSKGKPDWWIRKYLGGSFEHAEGMVYPNITKCFQDSETILKTIKEENPHATLDKHGIPVNWERFVNLDHGLTNPTAFYISAIDPKNGVVITYMEYYKAKTLIPEHRDAIKPLIDEIPAGRLRHMVADPSIRNKSDPINGKSVLGLYEEYGMYFTAGNNSIEAGILKVNSYIERGKWIIMSDKCQNLCKELIGYKFPEITMDDYTENLDEKPVKANDHGCLVAETLIETSRGQIPLSKVLVNDLVLTRCGYKHVLDWNMTDQYARVKTVNLSNGSSITGTGNHPVWVEGKGFLPIDSLRYGDIINVSPNWEESVCQNPKQLNTTDTSTDDTQTRAIYLTETISNEQKTVARQSNTCTEQSTKTTLAQSRKDFMSITKTGIRQTTQLETSSWLRNLNIFQSMVKNVSKTLNISNVFKNWLRNGTGLRQVMHGTRNMLENQFLNGLKQIKNLFVYNANPNLNPQLNMHVSALTSVSQNGAERMDSTMLNIPANIVARDSEPISMISSNSVPVFVVSVTEELERRAVYNLTVEGTHEYYANGILTHNCDSMRYGFMMLPDDPDMLKNLSYEPPMRYNNLNSRFVENEWGFNPDDDDFSDHNGRSWLSYM